MLRFKGTPRRVQWYDAKAMWVVVSAAGYKYFCPQRIDGKPCRYMFKNRSLAHGYRNDVHNRYYLLKGAEAQLLRGFRGKIRGLSWRLARWLRNLRSR